MSKKISAIFVALLMVLSILPMVFAQDANATAAESTQEVAAEGTAEAVSEPVQEATVDETAVAEGSDQVNQAPIVLEPGTTITEVPLDQASAETTAEVNDLVNATSADVSAADVQQAEQEVSAEANQTVSITPDQPVLWGLKRAIERIDLALTLGKSAKAQKGLVHARERLLEVQQMIAEKKMAAAQKAQNAYQKDVAEAEANTAAVGDGNNAETLAETAKINKEALKNALLLKKLAYKAAGKDLTKEQKNDLMNMIREARGQEAKVSAAVKAKEAKTKIKMKAAGNLSEEQAQKVKEKAKEKDSEKQDSEKNAKKAKTSSEDEQAEGNSTESETESEDTEVADVENKGNSTERSD